MDALKASAYLNLTGVHVSSSVHVLSTKLYRKNGTEMLFEQENWG